MKIILSNGVELSPIMVMQGGRFVYGANRDTLSFVFPAETSLDELDAIFTPSNCENITIYDDVGRVSVCSAYTIRAELKREPALIAPAAEPKVEALKIQTIVSMSQRTYIETQVAAMQAEMNALLRGEE